MFWAYIKLEVWMEWTSVTHKVKIDKNFLLGQNKILNSLFSTDIGMFVCESEASNGSFGNVSS